MPADGVDDGGLLAKLGVKTIAIPVHSERDTPEPAPLRQALETVTAVMCPNDPTLIATWELLRTWGLRVPEDVSLTGYDGIGQLASPVLGLTTWQQPVAEMAEAAAHEILRRIEDPAAIPRRQQIRGRLLRGRTLEAPSAVEVFRADGAATG